MTIMVQLTTLVNRGPPTIRKACLIADARALNDLLLERQIFLCETLQADSTRQLAGSTGQPSQSIAGASPLSVAFRQ